MNRGITPVKLREIKKASLAGVTNSDNVPSHLEKKCKYKKNKRFTNRTPSWIVHENVMLITFEFEKSVL